MNIVVVDGYTLNPGDLDWAALSALGNCEFHDRTNADELRSRLEGKRVVKAVYTLIVVQHMFSDYH